MTPWTKEKEWGLISCSVCSVLHDRGRLKMECGACNKRPSRPSSRRLCVLQNSLLTMAPVWVIRALSKPYLSQNSSCADEQLARAIMLLWQCSPLWLVLYKPRKSNPAGTLASALLNLISRPPCYYLHYFLNKPLMLVSPPLWSLLAHEAWFPASASLWVNKAISWATRLRTSIQTP